MTSYLSTVFHPSGLTPHGFCLLWQPGLIWLETVSDTLIGIAYFSIPVALVSFVRRRKDIAFSWIFWLFASFILACGTTHFLSVLTIWQPFYWLDGVVKAITASLSVVTAVMLWPLIPRALALPSPEALRQVNIELERKIAERDLAEAALRQSESQLRQVQKIETIGHLTGGIAHDFNNLLTVVLGGLEAIGRQVAHLPREAPAAAVGRSTAMAIRAVERATALTHSLLAFSRQQPLDPRPIIANDLVAGMSELLRRTLGEVISLTTILSDQPWTILADSNQLESALLNLAINARDAMPAGGTLTIETANIRLDEAYISRLAEPIPAGPYVMIAVSDTGTGMDEATLDRALEPFFTTKGVGRGTGLGLSQVFGFVRQSRGQMRLYSEPGHGTVVKLYLPRLIDRPEDESRPERPSAVMPVKPDDATILVVEDDPDLRTYSAQALQELGYRIMQAENGARALEILATPAEIDLLFTDVVLPGGMNGRELAEAARELRPALKVLFTTGYTRNAIVHGGQLDAGIHLVSKPFSYAELAAKVHGMLAERAEDSTIAEGVVGVAGLEPATR